MIKKDKINNIPQGGHDECKCEVKGDVLDVSFANGFLLSFFSYFLMKKKMCEVLIYLAILKNQIPVLVLIPVTLILDWDRNSKVAILSLHLSRSQLEKYPYD
jgi:hypothetical protein